MSIGKYAESKEFKNVDTGNYIVSIDDVSADLTALNPFLNIRYRIKGSPFANQCVFKRYYFTVNTFKKFMPWQLGIMGIWSEIKDCETFEDGLQLAVELLQDKNTLYNADVELESFEFKGKTGLRNNIILDSEFAGFLPQENQSNESKFDPNEEVPF